MKLPLLLLLQITCFVLKCFHMCGSMACCIATTAMAPYFDFVLCFSPFVNPFHFIRVLLSIQLMILCDFHFICFKIFLPFLFVLVVIRFVDDLYFVFVLMLIVFNFSTLFVTYSLRCSSVCS